MTNFIQQLWAFTWFSVTWFEIVKKKNAFWDRNTLVRLWKGPLFEMMIHNSKNIELVVFPK